MFNGQIYLLPKSKSWELYTCNITELNCERNISQFTPMCCCEIAVAVDLFEISVEAKESIAWFKYMGTKNALIDLICQRSRGLRVRIQLRSDYIESWVSYLNSSIMWHCVTIKRRSLPYVYRARTHWGQINYEITIQ